MRTADRFATELPLEFGGARGLTKNVSATGVYFETPVDKIPGAKVRFVVDVIVHGEALKMVCSGQVVRVEHKTGTVGIAVKLASSFFIDTDRLEEPPEPADD